MMQTIDQIYSSQTEVKRSKFLAFLVPIDRFEEIHAKLKADHLKANHIVWAKRHLNNHDQIVEESSDDGEPKGCAGRPVLRVMQGHGLIECGILIVRYFGGIKLGTGGMARAYGEAAKTVIESAELVPYEKEAVVTFFTLYAEVSRWEYLINQIEGLAADKHFENDGCRWRVSGPERSIEALKRRLEQTRPGFG